jgi:hypothetical protein
MSQENVELVRAAWEARLGHRVKRVCPLSGTLWRKGVEDATRIPGQAAISGVSVDLDLRLEDLELQSCSSS